MATKCSNCGQESNNQANGNGCHSCSKGIMRYVERCVYRVDREHNRQCLLWEGCKFGGDSGMM